MDGEWIIDPDAPNEDDGHYNINNYLLPSEIKRDEATDTADSVPKSPTSAHRIVATSSAPPGSNTAEGALTEAPTVSAGGDGAPLLTKEQSAANLARWIPHVTPDPDRAVTRTLYPRNGPAAPKPAKKDEDIPGAFPETPANEPDSFSVNPIPATGHQDTQSSVTTSKEEFENAGGVGTATDDQPVSVNPLPATGHKDIQSSVTTSKEDFDNAGGEGTATDDQQVSVNPLPATGHSDIQSSVTTSQEDYEKAGAFGTAGLAAAGVGVAGVAAASALSKPKETDKDIIPESSLPMNPEQLDTTDRGPFLNSAGPGTTTADLASQVPLEPKREAQVIDSSAPDTSSASKGTEPTPFISSSGPGTTTADLASQVPLEPKREAEVVDSSRPEAPEPSKEASATPFVSSVGAGATTAALASQVPLEPKRDAEVIEPTAVSKETDASPFISSSGPGTTTADLASQVPVEQKRQGMVVDDEPASPEVVAEKAALEKELLQKVPESEAKGEPESAAAAQSSYYGLATSVPEPVEESIAKAHASPEAATETSVVAEKSAVERELHAKVPVDESAGEPAPTLSAATATTAPAATIAADSVTDGKTANEAVPDTDTSTQTQGATAGEIAAGAVVGGSAAAGAAALAAKHDDKDAEPPRVDDSTKPTVNTEVAPASQLQSGTVASPGGFGTASTHPGVSPSAVNALSDGTEDPTVADEPTAVKTKAPAETSEATATEYAPPRAGGVAPGVSPSAAAALSDGTEDPTLDLDKPEAADIKETPYNTKHVEAGPKSSSVRTASPMSRPGEASAAGAHVAPAAPETPKKATGAGAGTSSTTHTPAKTTSTSTPESSTTGDKKKKRHRLSAFIKKVFD